MKQIGKCVTGQFNSVDTYTENWFSIRVHPGTYYRRQDEFEATFKKIKGLYTELDAGEFVIVRFSNKEDLTEFHRKHHTCI